MRFENILYSDLVFFLFSLQAEEFKLPASDSIVFPSGHISTDVIKPKDPYPCATMSDFVVFFSAGER